MPSIAPWLRPPERFPLLLSALLPLVRERFPLLVLLRLVREVSDAVVAMVKTPRLVLGHQTPGEWGSSADCDKASRSSASQASGTASEGMRQSPRGERLPPGDTLGPLGMAERLYWLAKNRPRKASSHLTIVAMS